MLIFDIQKSIDSALELFKARTAELRKLTKERKRIFQNLESVEMTSEEYTFAKGEFEYLAKVEEYLNETALHFQQWEVILKDMQESASIVYEGAEMREKLDFIKEMYEDQSKQNKLMLEIIGKK